MARVTWTDSALADLKSIIEYIAKDSPTYAKRVGSAIVEAPRRLEQFPLIGRILPELQKKTVREIICGPYRIIYQVEPEECSVVAVIHASRDVASHLKAAEWILE